MTKTAEEAEFLIILYGYALHTHSGPSGCTVGLGGREIKAKTFDEAKKLIQQYALKQMGPMVEALKPVLRAIELGDPCCYREDDWNPTHHAEIVITVAEARAVKKALAHYTRLKEKMNERS